MRNYRELISSPENLNWAWRKARRIYLGADSFVDFGEVSAFELDIERQLQRIGNELKKGDYQLRQLVHLPQPKKPDDDGPRMRQFFHVAVRDQVAWIAVANVIGPTLDSKMPNWSYGNRLYKAAWWEQRDGNEILELGPYRHSSGQLYRKFQHSWPLFRRHLSLTARRMVDGLGDEELLDEPERSALLYSERPDYLNAGYWPKLPGKTIYYASLDLERFYPSVTTDAIKRAFNSHLNGYNEDPWLQGLLSSLLDFSISRKGSCRLSDPLVQPITGHGHFPHIPTGLMIAGLLANVAMLPIDDDVERELTFTRRIAHFRFVDDHAILSSDFDALIAWVKKYELTLERHQIGAKISQSKYDPPGLCNIVRGNANDAEIKAVRKEAELDGSQPVRLITKTLALVSELATADFDILPEHSREQRLGELEWLLLASMPDTEIRADTRAAFAAGRIAQLVPVAFNPSAELIHAWRALTRLKSVEVSHRALDHDEKVTAAAKALTGHSGADLRRYRRLTAHYFKLIERAFTDHPNRARLLLRLFRYCRMTGHSGIAAMLHWIIDQSRGPNAPTAEYLSALALQALAVNIATAAFDLDDRNLLFRERRAARHFLLEVARPGTVAGIKEILSSGRERHCCDASSLSALQAAVAFALAVTARKTRSVPIARRMSQLADAIGAPQLSSESVEWQSKTGQPVGVWVHFLEMLGRGREPSLAWRLSAQAHDPSQVLDWIDLRKHPEKLPPHASEFLQGRPPRKLLATDAGWLLDHRRSPAFARSPAIENSAAGALVARYEKERGGVAGYISLLEWIDFISALPPTDPRASEWTALEILRSLLIHVSLFEIGSLNDLDELHPANLLLAPAWTEAGAATGHWTWTAWCAHVRSARVLIVHNKIKDYRRQPIGTVNTDPIQRWSDRLRGCGLLLLGLITKDFSLPASWNVRGLEREISGFVQRRLEEATISSRSQSIIEAATLPRSVETRMIRATPWAFFGVRNSDVITDTRKDPPLLKDPEDLKGAISDAQHVLEHNQLTVLNHAPRQLVPMNIMQLSRNAVEIPDVGL